MAELYVCPVGQVGTVELVFVVLVTHVDVDVYKTNPGIHSEQAVAGPRQDLQVEEQA